MKPFTFKLNDFQYTINDKLTLIQACLKNKVDVPRFCFHEKLSIAGNCRMCLVEDLKQVKPIASCAINVSNSMSVYTNTLKVKKAREAVLEFLLANHPLDCPICDQGGECDLQDQSVVFGNDRGRFYEFKRSVEDKDCGPLIKTIMNRCIHRTRCVRFSNEIAGTNVLGVTGRGSKMEIGFYIENLMGSELSGNIIDLCPVGALTSKPFAFTSRPWELKSYNSIDVFDSLHSNIRVDVRGTKIMRILPRVNSEINEDWITDKVRFSYDAFRRQRLYYPMVRKEISFVKVSWKKVFFLLKSFLTFKLKSGRSPSMFRAHIGEFLDLETLYLIRKFFYLNGSNYFVNSNSNCVDSSVAYSLNISMGDLEKTDFCLLVDLNLRVQSPILNSKIRRLVVKSNLPVYLIGYHSNFNYYTKHVSNSSSALLNILEGSHWLSAKMSKNFSMHPLVLVGEDTSKTKAFFSLLPVLFRHTNLIRAGWTGFGVLPTNSSFFSIQEVGFSGNHVQNSSLIDYPIEWLYNYDTVLNSKASLRIYQGHHGDVSAVSSNIVLPSTSFIEKSSLYSNVLGMVQKTKKVLFNVGDSRDDWKIINALIEVLGFSTFHVNNSTGLFSFITKILPFVLYKRSNNSVIVLDSGFFNHFFTKTFVSKINNFYLSDVITRNSKVMSLCFNKFSVKNYNFLRLL
jgi:NADH dehydrogenase (ubiquinone) Fe-S protein 1